jgi:hypothetical protein
MLHTKKNAKDDPVLSSHCGALESNHEEADTDVITLMSSLLLHAKHAMNTNNAVVIKSPDTDVFILCTAMLPNLESI